MPRRPSLSCRAFRHHHVDYVDGLLSGELRQACDNHRRECSACAARDVQIRRALLTLQALPTISPSVNFRLRLNARLAAEASARPLTFPAAFHGSRRPHARWWIVGSALAASTVLLVLAPRRPAPMSKHTAPAIVQAMVAPSPAVSATPIAATGPRARTRSETPRATPRFEALPGAIAPGGAPRSPHLSGVRLQTVTYIGQ
jgi:hypothetical protein